MSPCRPWSVATLTFGMQRCDRAMLLGMPGAGQNGRQEVDAADGQTHLVACWTLGSGCFCHTLISDLSCGWTA